MSIETKHKIQFLITMCSFGILGPIIKAIGFPSQLTACLRAWIAGLALLLYFVIAKKNISKETIKKCLGYIILCGICMAGDWICLFESYNYTTVATATICYYTEPIFVIIGSAIFLKEKIKPKHYLCIFIAFVGVALVSGLAENGLPKLSEILGVLIAVAGALFYTGIVLINKKFLKDEDPMFRTIGQLLVAGIVTVPYVLTTCDLNSLQFSPKVILLLLFLGIAMTAFTYIIYFSNIVRIPTKTAAIFSYGDPVVAVIVSVLFMHEPISIYGIIGAVLVIGAAIFSELE
ncbi:MAG: DMT family transporter [Bacillota bacterium]|nr:DMT family transporter [Bacillota bacterium]